MTRAVAQILLSVSMLLVEIDVAPAATNELSEAEIEGRRLAREILEMRPAENYTHDGVLNIFKSRGKPIAIPVRCEVTVTETNWTAKYSTQGTNKNSAASFTVIHANQQPNEYHVHRLPQASGQTNEFAELAGGEAIIPFAGSDFWLADLGLEFFQWPHQKILKNEMKKGQSCRVLESVNPDLSTKACARVVSWLDIDTGGIVQANAYDAKGQRLKEFEVKDVTKVKGQWQVSEFRIRNVQTGSHTSLKFNFKDR